MSKFNTEFPENSSRFQTSFESVTLVKGDKGDPGYTPQKGVDYWTDDDIAEINEHINEQTEVIRSDLEGIQLQIEREAHFRGYFLKNADFINTPATPNDFAYSAESGTKWVYTESEVAGYVWNDTTVPVPGDLTPASDTTPLIDGVASVGLQNAYARGDHRHPTDTTRVSVEEFNLLKTEIGYALEHIIEIQNSLMGVSE